MERFQKYLHRSLLPDRLADAAAIEGLGFRGRWIPEELQAFDEIELARSLDDATDLLLTLAVEEGKIARMMLGQAPAGDDDADAQGIPDDQMAGVLAAHGDAVEEMMKLLTQAGI